MKRGGMIGQQIAHYQIRSKLGEGGMGEVYLARDTRLRREVALKVLPAAMAADPEALKRFEREAQVVASLNHPGIVTIFSVEEADGIRFLTMELVKGQTLADLIPPGGMELAQFLEINTAAAAALAKAHERGVVHRDLKPANVMVTDDGVVKILDFGLAKLRREGLSHEDTQLATQTVSRAGTVLGTLPYMSPEQVEGKVTDQRTDIYSFGVMMHEMITGARPFQGDSAAALTSAILRDRAPSIEALRSGIPSHLARVIGRCMQKSPGRRYQTATDLRNELDELAAAATPATSGAPRSVAVLPFADMSPNKDQGYFCEGIAEELINALTRIQDLRVAPRMSAFQFKGHSIDLQEVGDRLDVDTVLSGGVRKAGNRVRITAELVSVTDSRQLWSERYDRELEDVFAVQDEISENIVKALEVTLSPKERKAIQTQAPVDVHAYEYYLRGRSLFHRFTKRTHERALQMYSRAIQIDPSFAAAYAGIADCCSVLCMYWDKTEANLQRADEASQRALELAPELAEAHASRGLALSMQDRYSEAREAFEAAIRLDPKLFEAHYFYARAAWQEGKLEESAEHFRQAMAIRPEDYQTPCLLTTVYLKLGDDEAAAATNVLAAEVIERHIELNPDDARALYLGAGPLIAKGDIEKALSWSAKAVSIDPTDSTVLYNVACTYCMLDKPEQGMDYLEKAVASGFASKDWIINDGDLDPLRDHPRFEALLASLD